MLRVQHDYEKAGVRGEQLAQHRIVTTVRENFARATTEVQVKVRELGVGYWKC